MPDENNINLSRQEYTSLFSGLQQIQSSMIELKEFFRESKVETATALTKLEGRLGGTESDIKALELEVASSTSSFSAGLRTAKYLLGGIFAAVLAMFVAVSGHLYTKIEADHDQLVAVMNEVKRMEVVRDAR